MTDIRTVTYEGDHVFFESKAYGEPLISATVVEIRIRVDRDLRRLNDARGLAGFWAEVAPCGGTQPPYPNIGLLSREEPPDDPQIWSILVKTNRVENLLDDFPGLRANPTAGAPYCMRLGAGNMLGMSAISQDYQLSREQMEAILSLVQDKYRNNPD